RLADTNRGSLDVERKRLGKVRKRLAVVDDAVAQKVEGEDTILAVGLHGHGTDDGALRDVGAHGDVVDSGADEHVVDKEGSDVRAIEVVCKGGIADLEGEDGRVGDVCVAVEVVAARVGDDGDVGLCDLEALEAVDARKRDGLLEGDLCGLEALDVD
ncbi:hypothetical protein V491_08606, partial [Pseudogymnoascus sp. VKM F-3775]